MTENITKQSILSLSEEVLSDDTHTLCVNALSKNRIGEIALNRKVICSTNHTFSNIVKTGEATNQQASGRCWIFAGLNTLRTRAMVHLDFSRNGKCDFELSQNFVTFWDKLEKSNYFLESILKTLNEPSDSRIIMHLLSNPIQDGGQWHMLTNVIKKYGLVPKEVMPETCSSSSTRPMNGLITRKLRQFASELRKDKESPDLRARKEEMMKVIFKMLSVHLGVPPTSFSWEWRDKDDVYHCIKDMTPHEFLTDFVLGPIPIIKEKEKDSTDTQIITANDLSDAFKGNKDSIDLDDFVCLIHCPTSDKPFNKMYTVDFLGNVIEGDIVKYLNVEYSAFEKAAVEMIKDGHPVWFGCDAGPYFEREMGILDTHVFDYDLVYKSPFTMTKAERVEYGDSLMTHAMVLTGVDLDSAGKPIKFKVENSWGTKHGKSGFNVMTVDWFKEYAFELAVPKKYLSNELRSVLDTEPKVLPPWDPMGALAM